MDQVLGQECNIVETDHVMTKIEMIKKKTINTFCFKIKDILQDVSEINGNMRVSIEVDGKIINYRIGIINKKIKKKEKKLCRKPRDGRKKKKRDSAVQDYRRFL